MTFRPLFFCCLVCPHVFAPAQEPPTQLSKLHDGRWAVVLICPDTRDKSGSVKGYEYTFWAIIEGGKLKGQFGVPSKPDSVVYTGTVSEDGTLKISAVGNTGQPGSTAGKVASGTGYFPKTGS